MMGKHSMAIGIESRAFAFLARNWALVFLAAMFIVFSFTGEGFLDYVNFQNIMHMATLFILLAIAETFIIITGGIDLSAGFVMGLSSVVSAKIIQVLFAEGMTPWTAIFIGATVALAVSFIPGLINGILVARYNVPPFIATLGMWGICNGITLKICHGFPVPFLPDELTQVGNGYFLYILPKVGLGFFTRPEWVANTMVRELSRIFPNSLFLSIPVIAISWHVLNRTKFGQYTFAIGGSQEAAKRAGIDVRKHLMKIYILSSMLAGLAGVFNVFQTGIGNFTPFNAMYELFAVAAVVIGGASLMGGKGRILGSVIGVILLGVLENGLSISGVQSFYRFIAVGLILIVAVVIDQLFPDLF